MRDHVQGKRTNEKGKTSRVAAFLIFPFTFFLLPFAERISVGSPVPDFELVAETGAPFRLGDLKGQVVAVTFIYTRCPLPEFCPRAMANFAALRDRFRARLGGDLTLLTITFDPTHDTPARLREYAAQTGAGGPGWRFLTGTRDSVDRVCALFGVEVWPEEGAITHEIVTAVIDREGRLVARIEGSRQTAQQIGDAIAVRLK